MKLSLVVQTTGNSEGKVIPITLSQFLIGRDPQCHLRPASAVISKRHCALLVRGDKAYVRDFDSTNGTFVNDEPVKGERPLQHQDRLKVGPLVFHVQIEASTPVSKPTPPPVPKASADGIDDESAAALLLSLQDDASPSPGSPGVDSEGIPTGSTVMDILSPTTSDTAAAPEEESRKPDSKKAPAKPAAAANTSQAAKAILEKYMRRPRT